MCPFSIGLSALEAGSHLVNVAGHNIANANTPGYHAKEALRAPVEGPLVGGVRIGLGVAVLDVDRIYDALIERSLLTHLPLEAMFQQESDTLGYMEMLFNEPTDNGLDAQVGSFFDAVTQLAALPNDPILREQVVQKADALCAVFNGLDEGLRSIGDGLVHAIRSAVNDINGLTTRIADLNVRVLQASGAGRSAPDLEDLRDQLISQLAELVNVEVYPAPNGGINLSSSGTLLVSGKDHLTLEADEEDGQIIITRPGGIGIPIDIRGGRLAGLLGMANEIVPQYNTALDELAGALRRSVNAVHAMALPISGRFHSLEGTNAFATGAPFYDMGYGVTEGTTETLYMNVEDEATGEVTRYELTVDTTVPADQFLIDLRDAINNAVTGVDHVTAGIGADRLNLAADAGYAFGFATPYDPNPAQPGDMTAADPSLPTILDAYTGPEDLQYDVTFLTGGTVGVDEIQYQIQISEPAGPVLRTYTLTLPASHDPREGIAIENGLKLRMSEGDINAGDGFSFVANATNDSAGVLDALGLNTFFTGLDARTLAVEQRILHDPTLLAGSIRHMSGDNHRFLEMANLAHEPVAADGTMTMAEFYRSFLSELSVTRTSVETHLANQQQIVRDLTNQRDSVSGVSVDEEMVSILQARTIYQGGLKYIQHFSRLLDDLAMLL